MRVLMFWFFAILLLIILANLFGCYSASKARQQFAKAAVAYPEIPADYCARIYPSKDTTITIEVSDSTKYKEVLEGLQGDLYSSNQLIDSLIFALQNGDTTCRKYASFILELQRQVISLKQKVITIPPITTHTKTIKTEINTAALDLANINLTRSLALSDEKTKEAASWKQKAKKRFWLLVGLSAAMVLGIVAMVRRKVMKKVV